MTHIAISTAPRPTSGARPAEEGPIVLAAKPFDGTEAPLAVARWLAQREDRALHVVSVLERNDSFALAAGVPPLPPGYYEEERSAIAARIEMEIRSSSHENLDLRIDVLDGPSARSIVDVAHDRGARMIVIGTGRHEPLGRFVYGERAIQIVRVADRPVLVVPRMASAGFVRHAIVAVDFSPASLRAAVAVLPMLSRGSRLTLLHVKPAVEPSSDAPRRGTTASARCTELFERFRRLLHVPPGVDVETRVLWGDPVVSLDEFARASGVSLIACGRRQNYSLTERLFVGSVSAGLVRRVNCPVLIAPEPGDGSVDTWVVPLTGMETWPREDWVTELESFNARNRNRRLRLSLEGSGDQGARSVMQNYLLRAIAFNRADERLSLMLGDQAPSQSILSLRVSDASAFTLYTDIAGRDVRLRFESPSGTGIITVAPAELPLGAVD